MTNSFSAEGVLRVGSQRQFQRDRLNRSKLGMGDGYMLNIGLYKWSIFPRLHISNLTPHRIMSILIPKVQDI